MNQMTVEDLFREVRRVFIVAAAGAVLGLLAVFLLHTAGIAVTPPLFSVRAWGILTLILSVLFGVALPILMRTYYHEYRFRKRKADHSSYRKLQINLVIVSTLGAYVALVAYLFSVPKLHLGASVIAGIYGVYSSIPSKGKHKADMNYYGLTENSEA